MRLRSLGTDVCALLAAGVTNERTPSLLLGDSFVVMVAMEGHASAFTGH